MADCAKDKAWLKTTTGGYDINRNAIVERRNGKLQAGHRALLLGAIGGRLYYEELWDVAMEHMADIANHLLEAGHRTLVMIAGGEELQIEDMMEAFGAQAYYYEATERSKLTPQVSWVYMWADLRLSMEAIALCHWNSVTGFSITSWVRQLIEHML